MNKQIKSIPLPHLLKEVLGAWLLIGSSLLLACCTEAGGLMERSGAMVTFSLASTAATPEVAPTRSGAVDMETGTKLRVLAYRRPDGSGTSVLSSDNYVGEAVYQVASGSTLEPVSTPLQLITGTYDFYAVTPELDVDHSGSNPTVEVPHHADYAVSVTSKSISPGNSTVGLSTLERRCALVRFETDRKVDATGITSAVIHSATLTAMAQAPQKATGVGQLTPTTGGSDLVLSQFNNSTDAGNSCQSEGQMVVLPKSSSASTLTMNVSFNKESPVELKAGLQDVVFESGKKYTFSIRFQEQGTVIELLLAITPWTSLEYNTETGELEELPVKVIVLGKWTDIDYGNISQGGLGSQTVPLTVSGWVSLNKETDLAGLGSLNNPFKVAGWGSLTGNAEIGIHDLSRDASGNIATANCYIVTANNEICSFNATVPGNNSNVTDITKPTNLSTATEARVIWQTGTSATTGLVVDLNSVKLQGGKVFFVTGSAITGNAVIGIFASSAVNAPCLWSWHIWKLSSMPETIACTKTPSPSTASRDFNMMDRNLGAYNNTPGSTGSIGLMYQWGRKDPFPGPKGFNTTEPDNIYGTYDNGSMMGSWSGTYSVNTAINNATVGTEAWVVKYPTAFIGSNSLTWLYTPNNNLWGTPWVAAGSVGGYNGSQGTKSIYDPCPIGYRVPPQDFANRAIFKSVSSNGMYLKGMAVSDIWFASQGRRNVDTGSVNNASLFGYYWSSSSNDSNLGCNLYLSSATQVVKSLDGASQVYALPIRCVSE